MPALAWVMLVLGMLAGGLVGFVVSRLVGVSSGGDAAMALAIAKADADRAAVDAEAAERAKRAETMSTKELADALEADFSLPATLPPDHPLRRPPGGK